MRCPEPSWRSGGGILELVPGTSVHCSEELLATPSVGGSEGTDGFGTVFGCCMRKDFC